MSTYPQFAEPLDPDDTDKAYNVPFQLDAGVEITDALAAVVDETSTFVLPDTDMAISSVAWGVDVNGNQSVSFVPSLGGTTTPQQSLYRIRFRITTTVDGPWDHTVQIKVQQN